MLLWNKEAFEYQEPPEGETQACHLSRRGSRVYDPERARGDSQLRAEAAVNILL